ncbi:MAG: hypothetical protein H6Q67_1874 [Firmicutes bacterium]|nr:hypothetical protein [Bacillota bacterium]
MALKNFLVVETMMLKYIIGDINLKIYEKGITRNMKKLILMLFTMSYLLLANSFVFAQDVTAEGQGTSRDGAIASAERAAVEQTVGVLLDTATVTANYQVISDEIFTNSQGYITDYDVIDEHPGIPFTVTIRATVDTSPDSVIRSKLQQLHLVKKALQDPRIAVIIPESMRFINLSSTSCETSVIQKLHESGFAYVLDPDQLSIIKRKQLLECLAANNLQAAKTIAMDDQLDYLIVGQATSQYVGDLEQSGVKSIRAHVDAKLIKVDTAEIIATQSVDTSGVDITSQVAAEKAFAVAGTQLAETILPQFMQYAADPSKPITLIFKQASFKKILTVEDLLKAIPGVRDIQLRSYKDGTAKLNLTYPGTVKTLTEVISSTATFPVTNTNLTNSTAEFILN